MSADPIDDFLAWTETLTDEQREGFRRQQLANRGFDHYLSTACWHERHDYCSAMTGYQGVKRPAQCKFCDARCECDCHREEIERAHAVALERERRRAKWAGTVLATPAVAGAPEAPPKNASDLQERTEEDR